MPVFEIQHGNRTFEIEADAEPSPADLELALSQVGGLEPTSNPVADMGRRALKSANTGAQFAFTALANASDAVSEKMGFDKSENTFFRTRAERAAADAEAVKTDPARDNEIKSMIAEGVGGAVPAILAGAASPVLGMATLAGQTGEGVRERALAEGDSPEIAAEKAKIGRLGGAVMGLLPGQVTRPGARIAERAVTGAATGAAINAGQEEAMAFATGQEGDTKRAAVVGAAMGGAFGAASRGRKASSKETPTEPVSAADKAIEDINAGIRADAEKSPQEAPKSGLTPKEIAAELVRTPPEKIESLKEQVARGDEVDYQYSVWDKEMIPEGADRAVQIDIIPKNPDEANTGGLGSTNRKVLAALGVDLPPVPDWVPPGSYTKADMEALIKQGAPPEGAEVVFEPAAMAKEATPEPSVSGAPEVGLGAAAAAEFQPVKEFTTSARNEQMDAEAVARGQDPAMKQARQADPEVWDQAMKRIDEDQNYPDRLIVELKEKSRPIDAADQLVLAHRNIELQNQFNKAERNIAENIGTPDSLANDRATQERLLDEMLDLRNVLKQAGGSEVGRSLRIRKAFLNEDFSLANMLAEARVAKGGDKLTPEQIDAVRKQHAEIEEANKALAEHEAQQELDDAITTPEEAAEQVTKLEKQMPDENEQFRKRTQKRIDEINKRIRDGDFSKKPKREVHLDEESNKLKAELELAKERFNKALEQDRYRQKTKFEKGVYQAGNTVDFIRALMTTGEFSFIGRQGFTNLLGHPIRTAKSIPDAARALFADEATARAIDMKTRNDPMAEIGKEAGLHLDDPSAPLNKTEEAIASRWAEKVPVLRNFNQSARVFLNRMRLDSFKAMAEANPGIDESGLKALASFANVATGRGSLGEWGDKHAMQIARLAMFSPRFVSSRIQYTLGVPLWGGNKATRMTIAREYARTLAGIATFYTLYSMARTTDDDKEYPPVSFDPRSSKFGNIKLGATTIDPLAGMKQALVWETRNALTIADSAGIDTGGQSVDGKGKLTSLRNPAYGRDDWGDMNVRFARTKAAPIPGAIINAIEGRDVVGQPTTWAEEAAGLVRPMTWWDLGQAFKEHDLPEYSVIFMAGLLGAGIQNEIDRGKPKEGRTTVSDKEVSLPSGAKAKVRNKE